MVGGSTAYTATAGARTDVGHQSGSSRSTSASPRLLPAPQPLHALGLLVQYCFPCLNNFGFGRLRLHLLVTSGMWSEEQNVPGGCLTDAADH